MTLTNLRGVIKWVLKIIFLYTFDQKYKKIAKLDMKFLLLNHQNMQT